MQIVDAAGEIIAEGDGETAATARDLGEGTYVVRVHPTGDFGTYQLQTRCSVKSVMPLVEGGCSAAGGAAPLLGALGLLGLLLRRRRR